MKAKNIEEDKMYFNNVHILIYVAIAVAGFFIGKFVNWCNYRLPEYKPVF